MMGLPSRQVAQRDLTSHSRLKLRRTRGADGESAEEKLKRLKRELGEQEHEKLADVPASVETSIPTVTRNTSKSQMHTGEAEKSRPESHPAQANEDVDADADADADAKALSSSEDEDEGIKAAVAQKANAADVALQKELERVKMERQIKAQQEAAMRGLTSNPLLEPAPIQRRWDDDVIFRNQAKGEVDQRERRFVNDIVHSDVHKNFLKKHIL